MIFSTWARRTTRTDRPHGCEHHLPNLSWALAAVTVLSAAMSLAACGPGAVDRAATATSQKAAATTARPKSTTTRPSTTRPSTTRPTTTLPPVALEPQIAGAVADINGFASRAAPMLGLKSYQPPTPDRLGPWSLIDATCDGRSVPFRDVENNALAMPCGDGPMVLWDKQLFSDQGEDFGAAANVETISHEIGHVVQFQYEDAEDPYPVPSFVTEQFADCFSGAYVAEARSRNVEPLSGQDAIDGLYQSAFLQGDLAPGLPQPSTRVSDSYAYEEHGLGFDRLRVFDLGFRMGFAECAKFFDEPPKRVASTLVMGRDSRAGRAVPIGELTDLLAPTVRAFAASQPGSPDIDDTEMYRLDRDDIDGLRADYGDGVVFWAVATESVANTQRDQGKNDLSKANLEYQSCWFGAWIAWLGQGKAESIRLSDTDLDGSLYAVLAYSYDSDQGSSFRNLSAMLAGYRAGVGACDNLS